MQSQKAGQIINVSSVAGQKVGLGGAVYAGTKWAVRAISEWLRQEVKPWNIRLRDPPDLLRRKTTEP